MTPTLAGPCADRARVLGLDGRATVPCGSFEDLLVTGESTPLEPRLLERKHGAGNVGPVLVVTVNGGSDREELTSFEKR